MIICQYYLTDVLSVLYVVEKKDCVDQRQHSCMVNKFSQVRHAFLLTEGYVAAG